MWSTCISFNYIAIIGRIRALHSLAAFEPYCFWPHSSLTFIGRIRALVSLAAFEPYISSEPFTTARGDNDRAPVAKPLPYPL